MGRGAARRVSLDERILAAHRSGEREALAGLYAEAARAPGDEDARAFFLTQAWVLALEAGAPSAEELRRTLVSMGRDA
jgi:hypothetical protein